MATKLPSIVVVTGAWHVPAHYESFTTALTKAGYSVHCPLLPTCSGARPPNSSLQDDANVIRALLVSLVEKGESILVLMHSYGGIVGSNAVTPELYAVSRTRAGRTGGVAALIYMCAFLLPLGESIASKSPTRLHAHDPVVVAEDLSCIMDDPRPYFYNDLGPTEADACEKMLVPHNVATFAEPVTETPWKVVPTTYLLCEEDCMTKPEWQWERISAARELGAEIRVEKLKSGHSPFVSKVHDVVQVVGRAWEAVGRDERRGK